MIKFGAKGISDLSIYPSSFGAKNFKKAVKYALENPFLKFDTRI